MQWMHDILFYSLSPVITGVIVTLFMWWLNNRYHKRTREHLRQQDRHLSTQDQVILQIHDKIKRVK